MFYSITYNEQIIYIGHTGFVTSICSVPKSSNHPNGLTITGSRDTTILVFPRNNGDASHTLTGHSDCG